MMLMLALPFLDLRRERRLSRRPVAVVIFDPDRDRDGDADLQGRDREGGARAARSSAAVPTWVKKNRACRRTAASPGAKLFAQSGCLTCHTYLGTGSSNLGAPDLTAEGREGQGIEFQIDHLKCPSCVNAGLADAAVRALGDDNLRKLAIFLEASKGAASKLNMPLCASSSA